MRTVSYKCLLRTRGPGRRHYLELKVKWNLQDKSVTDIYQDCKMKQSRSTTFSKRETLKEMLTCHYCNLANVASNGLAGC